MNLKQYALAKKLGGGGSAPAVIEAINIDSNGTYTAPQGVDGFNPIVVDIPSEYEDSKGVKF